MNLYLHGEPVLIKCNVIVYLYHCTFKCAVYLYTIPLHFISTVNLYLHGEPVLIKCNGIVYLYHCTFKCAMYLYTIQFRYYQQHTFFFLTMKCFLEAEKENKKKSFYFRTKRIIYFLNHLYFCCKDGSFAGENHQGPCRTMQCRITSTQGPFQSS